VTTTASDASSDPGPLAAFRKTRWTLLHAAARDGDEARRALLDLCLNYWSPVYAYVRRCGHGPARAHDITQAFFADLVQRPLPTATEIDGPFRRWLMVALTRFLATDWSTDAATAPPPDLAAPEDPDVAEQRDRAQNAEVDNAELAFQRSFALAVVGTALNRLRNEAAQAGRLPLFDALEPWLGRDPAPGLIEETGKRLGLSPLAMVMALRRLRQRFHELVDAELSDTVADPATLAAERAALLAALER
jgi:RNA polymerase sigma-70 factor (ECF subfamily)